MVFSFIYGYTRQAIGYIEDAVLTEVNIMYCELLLELYFRRSKEMWNSRAWTSSMDGFSP